MRRTTLALCALPLLAACAPEVETTIYLTDVLAVAEGGEPMQAPALLRIPQASADGCADGLDALTEAIRPYIGTPRTARCIERDRDAFAEYETIAVLGAPGAELEGESLFRIDVEAADDAERIGLRFGMTRPIEDIVAAISSSGSLTNFDPTVYLLRLHNDGEATLGLMGNHVFIDGEPGFLDEDPLPLGRRDQVDLRLSDVASAHVDAGHGYDFAEIDPVISQVTEIGHRP